MMAVLGRLLPWAGCLLVVWLWHTNGVNQATATERLTLAVGQQNETLLAQEKSIEALQRELESISQLTLQVQKQAGQLLTEQGQAQGDIKEIIINEPCRITELPSAAALRLRQLATTPLDKN